MTNHCPVSPKREKTQINKIRNERGEITTDTAGIQKKKQKQNKKLYKNTINNYMTTEEIDKFLETWSPLKLNKEEINNLNKPITRNEIESVIFKNFLQIKVQDQIASQAKSTKELIPIFLKLFQKSEKESTLPKTFYEATITIIPKSDKHYQKRKLQANIFDEFRFKNS